MKKFVKYTLYGVACTCLLLLILLLCAAFYIHTGHARNRLLTYVNQNIKGRIQVQNHAVSLISGKVVLDRVTILDALQNKLISVDQLVLKIDYLPLLKGVLSISHLSLQTPVVNLIFDKDDQFTLTNAFESKTASKELAEPQKKSEQKGFPFNIVVKDLSVTNGHVRYEDMPAQFAMIFEKINGQASGNLADLFAHIRLDVGKMEIHTRESQTNLFELTSQGDIVVNSLANVTLAGKTEYASFNVAGGIDKVFTHPDFDTHGNFKLNWAFLKKRFELAKDYNGNMTGQFNFSGTLDFPRFAIDLNQQGGEIAGYGIKQIMGHLDHHDQKLDLDNWDVKTTMGDASFSGHINFEPAFSKGYFADHPDVDKIAYHLSGTQKNLDLTRFNLFSTLKKENKGSQKNKAPVMVSSRFDVSGKGASIERLAIQGDASADIIYPLSELEHPTKFVSEQKKETLQVDTHFSLRDQQVKLDHLILQSLGARVQANAGLNLKSKAIQADLKGSVKALERLLAVINLDQVKGEAQWDATVRGSLNNPVIRASVTGQDIGFEEFPIGNVDLGMTMDQGTLVLKNLDIVSKKTRLNMAGNIVLLDPKTFELNKNPKFSLQAKGKDIHIRPYYSQADGLLDFDAAMEGSIKDPTGNIKAKATQVTLYDQPISKIELQTQLKNKRFNIEKLNIYPGGDDLIRVLGWVGLDQRFDLAAQSKQLTLKHIQAIAVKNIINGKAGFEISGKGRFDNPVVNGVVHFADVSIKGEKIRDCRFQVSLAQGQAKVMGNLGFDVSLAYQLKNHDFGVSCQFDQTELSPYFEMLGRKELTGRVTGDVKMDGNIDHLDRVSAHAKMTQLDLNFQDRSIVKSQSFRLDYENGVLSLPDYKAGILDDGYVSCQATLSKQENIDVTVSGKIPVKSFEGLIPQFPQTSGYLSIESKIQGPLSVPVINGTIAFVDVGVKIPETYQEIKQINGKVRFDGQSLYVDHIVGHLDSGEFDLGGKIDVNQYRIEDVAMKLDLKSFPINVPDTLNLKVDSALTLTGNDKHSLLKGDIVLLEGTYYKDFDLSLKSMVGPKPIEPSPFEKLESVYFLNNVGLDIDIRRRNRIFVDNNHAFLDVHPDLKLGGFLSIPVISGRASIGSGSSIFYLNKEFKVSKGVIDFINPYKNEPYIDLKGEVDVRKWKIQIELTGLTSELKLNLYSDPAAEEEDILSLLAFGKTTKELIGGDGGKTASASQMMAELVTSAFGDDIKAATGLDIIEVQTENGQDETDAEKFKITLGKKLSKRMTVKYAMETQAGEVIQEAITEYKFMDNILVDGYQGTKGRFGAELVYQINFR